MGETERMKVSGCLFDFDGVVVDSFVTHLTGWQQAFTQLFQRPLPDCPPEELTGKSSLQIARYLVELVDRPERAAKLLAAKTAKLVDGSLVPPLRPGAREAMQWCRRQGIPFGIGSNAPAGYVRAAMQAHAVDVPVIYGFEDVRKPKPAPDLYELCARQAGIPISRYAEVLVFEDSPPGITAAVKAGMYPVGILAKIPADVLRRCGAREIYTSLAEWLTLTDYS